VNTVLADAMVVSTVAVTDLDRAKRFFQDQLGLPLLDETPFAFRFGAGRGTQM
jgi:catechol 2,3-dioxygenase-like lactoylglutathione lyase family enzyme